MTTQYVNGWELGLDFDITPFKKGAKVVEDTFNKLEQIQYNTASAYQVQLDKQLATLKQQEAILKKIKGAPGAPSRPTAPRRPTTGRASLDIYGVTKDIDFFSSQLKTRFKGNETQLERFQEKVKLLKGELSKVGDAKGLRKIRADFRDVRREAQVVERGIRKVNRELQRSKYVTNAYSSSLNNLARGYLSVFTAIQAAGAIYRQAKALSSTRAALQAGAGSAVQAAKDFEFLRETSLRLGTDLLGSAKGFSQLSIAAKEAGLSQDQAKAMFIATSEAATAFGMTADDAYGVTKAMVQMLSKGTVSAEELRGQMGDRMPIAVSTMAKAVGVSNGELLKMMEQGKIVSKDVLPKFSEELRIAAREGGSLFAGLKSIQAQENRVRTAFTAMTEAFTEGGGEEGIAGILEGLAGLLTALKPVAKFLGLAFKDIVRRIQTLFSPFTMIFQAYKEIFALSDKGFFTNLGSLFGVGEEGGRTREQFKEGMLQRIQGTAGSTSVRKSSTTNNANTNNITFNFTSTAVNAKDMRRELDNYTQEVLKPILVPNY